MDELNLESLLKIFSFEKKRDLERYCREVTIRAEDFVALVLACEHSGKPFGHEISYRDKVPQQLVPSDSEIEALKNTPAGTVLTGEGAKAARKMSQSFEDRRYLVGHMFFTPDYSKWHFFCFDQRDTETNGNHWKEGSHVHFVNWLWPGQNAQSVWSNFVTQDSRPGGVVHLRFVEKRESGMETKKCEFDYPNKIQSSTALHSRIFNQDVGFRFEVNIKTTDQKDIEDMLKLFEQATTDFKETWRNVLAELH